MEGRFRFLPNAASTALTYTDESSNNMNDRGNSSMVKIRGGELKRSDYRHVVLDAVTHVAEDDFPAHDVHDLLAVLCRVWVDFQTGLHRIELREGNLEVLGLHAPDVGLLGELIGSCVDFFGVASHHLCGECGGCGFGCGLRGWGVVVVASRKKCDFLMHRSHAIN